MQLLASSPNSRRRGVALITTIMFAAVVLIVFASIFEWANSNAIMTQRDNQYNMSQNAAEAAVERIIGQLDRDFVSLSITNSSAAYSGLVSTIDQTTWPVNYVYSDLNGATGQVSVILGTPSSSTVPLNSQYTGLSAYAQQVDVYATATPSAQLYNVPATVHESLQFANIPLFQFAIFYNVNLEVMSAAALNIYGPVFCNQNIWEGSNLAVFYNAVTAVGTNAPQAQDPFSDYTGSGASTFTMSGQPLNHAHALVMPIGTNNSPGAVMSILDLPPSTYSMGTPAAYSSNGLVYPANAADLYVTNFVCGTNDGTSTPAGTNYLVYFQDSSLIPLPFDYYKLKTGGVTNYVPASQFTNIYFAGMSWITNVTFYDSREGWHGNSGTYSGPAKRVEAVQVDVAKLTNWMFATTRNGGSDPLGVNPDPNKVLHAGHHIDSIYVYDSVALTGNQLPAVRVVNGAQLPSAAGFTVVTPFPMYVKGNYNVQTSQGNCVGWYGTNGATVYSYPSALMADAITILSSSFNDGDTAFHSTGNEGNASSTTVNAAMLEGIVQSNPNMTGNVGMNGDYSGGVENFLRLLENWGSQTLTYNGSIVVLFYSQYATNSWRQTGHYYGAPTRHWAFDLNFQNAAKLPPLTPQLKAMVRGNWYAHQ